MSNSKLLKKELNNKSQKDLEQERSFFKKELFNLRFQKALGELKNHSRFSFARKSIARINTELTRRSKVGEQ